jgi:tetratricopeptide (TPR) repeat protein
VFRRRWPLAAAGVFLFLLFLAPTSSFVPIADAVAERRVYFPFVGLVLILLEGARRLRLTPNGLAAAGAAVLGVLGIAAHSRASVWGDELRLWQDTVEKSPGKMRPRFQLAHLYYRAQRCGDAVTQYAEAAKLATKPDSSLLVDWALALDCSGSAAEAVEKLREAAGIDNSYHVHSQLGMVLARIGRGDEALAALAESERLKQDYAPTHVYKGNVYATQGRLAEADAAFRRALELDPTNEGALAGRRFVAERLGQQPATTVNP